MTTGRFRKDHIPELDGIRGIAVLLVLWVHLPVGALGEGVKHLRGLIIPGNLGVDLFFVLSGFLITRILLVERERGVPVRYFLIRRFLRIFPIYYLTIVLLLDRHTTNESIAAALYLTNYYSVIHGGSWPIEHSWSLAVEEHFYMFWPPIVAFLAPATSRKVLLRGIIPVALLTMALAFFFGPWQKYSDNMSEFVLRSSTGRFLSLGMGAVVAYHEQSIRDSKRLAGIVVAVAAAVGLLLTVRALTWLGLIDLLRANPATAGHESWFMAPIRVIAFPCISLAIVVAGVAWSGSISPHAWVMRLGILRWIGRISYGLYLYHFPIFQTAGIWGVDWRSPDPIRVVAVLGLCFAVSAASFYVIEKPILRYGSKFRVAPKSDSGGSDPAVPAGATS